MVDYDFQQKGIKGLVSVIIPTHNRAHLISETIYSILGQYYKDIEIIIVDDHSTDNTENIVNKMNQTCVRYIKSLKFGACAARNIGFFYSRGEYIQFFDDDDIMLADHINKKVDILQTNDEYDYVCCNYLYFKESLDNFVGDKRVDNIEHTIESHLLNSGFPTPSFLCRRKTINVIGLWNESCLKFQDICYFHRLFLKDMKGYWIDEYLFKVRSHSINISNRLSIEVLYSVFKSFEAMRNEWLLLKADPDKKRKVDIAISIYEYSSCLKAIKYMHLYWGIKHLIIISWKYPESFLFFMKYTINRLFTSEISALDLLQKL